MHTGRSLHKVDFNLFLHFLDYFIIIAAVDVCVLHFFFVCFTSTQAIISVTSHKDLDSGHVCGCNGRPKVEKVYFPSF